MANNYPHQFKWLPGAEHSQSNNAGTMEGKGSRKIVLHASESDPGSIKGVVNWVHQQNSEYHFVIDDKARKVVQLFPANKAARSMMNGGINGGVGCNRSGEVCIQICIVGRARNNPIQHLSQWALDVIVGIGDAWGVPHRVVKEGRDAGAWLNQSGYFGHANAPGNDHTDPGGFNEQDLFKGGHPPLSKPQKPGKGKNPTPPAKTPPPPPPAASKGRHVVSRVVKQGGKGKAVRFLQEKLGVVVDGVYGPHTEKAVRKFQHSHGLTADGIVGRDTWRKLGVRYVRPVTVNKVVKPGAKGDLVRLLQRRLQVEETGKYDTATVARVRQFQRARGLVADGVVGEKTWDRIPGVSWQAATGLILNPGAKLPTQKALVKRLQAVAKDLGVNITIISGKRTIADQWRLWNLYQSGRGNKAAYPNANAPHVRGVAADCAINGVNIGNYPGAREAMRKHGLCLNVSGEPWHVQVGNDWYA